MGSYVSATFGYGIRVPSGEDDDYDPSPFAEQYADEDESIDWYELLEAVCTQFGTSFDVQYAQDYSEGAVLFSNAIKSHNGITYFDRLLTPGDSQPLEAIARLLGIEYDPKWFLVASYG